MLATILGFAAKNPTEIASLKVDIVRTIDYQLDQDVSSHPVETGFEVHDNIVNHPMRVNMTVGISSTPVTWLYKNGTGGHKFNDGFAALMAIRDAKQEIAIVRPDRVLSGMVMTSCRLVKNDESKSVMWVDIALVQIAKVVTQTVEIPKDIVTASMKESAGETAADGGIAKQSTVNAADSIADEVAKVDNRSLLAKSYDGVKEASSGNNKV